MSNFDARLTELMERDENSHHREFIEVYYQTPSESALAEFLVNNATAIRDLVAAAEKSVKTGTTASRNELEAALAKLEEA